MSQSDLLKIFELIDLTSLNDTDDAHTIISLCKKAMINNHHVAAVCVYPPFVTTAKESLANDAVRVATVANFPAGTGSLEDVQALILQSIADGADEVDVVFPYQQYLRGEKAEAFDFVRACKLTCGENVLLKVILETGALQDAETIAEVSYNVCHAGADFLKTSTGKISVGATPEAARAMLGVLRKIPRPIGFKVSGGVRTIDQAQQYISIAEEMMGEHWVTPKNFRIGASQLVDVLRG